jgi:hypothetical protein
MVFPMAGDNKEGKRKFSRHAFVVGEGTALAGGDLTAVTPSKAGRFNSEAEYGN